MGWPPTAFVSAEPASCVRRDLWASLSITTFWKKNCASCPALPIGNNPS